MQEKSLIKQNILQFIDIKGISKYKFYQETGITRGILDQNNGMSEENTTRFLACFPEINPEWLLTGKGEMLKTTKEEVTTPTEATPTATNCQETKALAEDRAYIIELQKKEIGRLEQELAGLQRTLQTKKTI